MKVTITAVETRLDGKLHSVTSVVDCYSEVYIAYPTEAFNLKELQEAIKIWGIQHWVKNYLDGAKILQFLDEAHLAPSIGRFSVSIVEREVDWPD